MGGGIEERTLAGFIEGTWDAAITLGLLHEIHAEATGNCEVEGGGSPQTPSGQEDVGRAAAFRAAGTATALAVFLRATDKGAGAQQAWLLHLGAQAGRVAKPEANVAERIVSQGAVTPSTASQRMIAERVVIRIERSFRSSPTMVI